MAEGVFDQEVFDPEIFDAGEAEAPPAAHTLMGQAIFSVLVTAGAGLLARLLDFLHLRF